MIWATAYKMAYSVFEVGPLPSSTVFLLFRLLIIMRKKLKSNKLNAQEFIPRHVIIFSFSDGFLRMATPHGMMEFWLNT